MGRYIKIISRTLIICFILLAVGIGCCPRNRLYPKSIFKSKMLNDSLDKFLLGSIDIPEANYPTVTYVCVGRDYDGIPVVVLVSSPGHHMWSMVDSSIVQIGNVGIYQGKFVRVFCAPSLRGLLQEKEINKLSLDKEEHLRIERTPRFLREGGYQRLIIYKLYSPGQIKIARKTDNV